ncbi:MAG TPA: protein phosphatase 2C domain-containing protein [Blastocatellia bacterium]|nr:protein phosphatase 2C domain-containing protein [Blastocatellia bacterium]
MSGAPLEVRVQASGQTDVGRVRQHNEDAFVIADLTSGDVGGNSVTVSVTVGERGVLLGVSDGMGGAQAGDVASTLVVDSLRAHLGDGSNWAAIQDSMKIAVEKANHDVWNAAQTEGRRGMGATLTAVLVHRSYAYFASVGDSRAYLIRNGFIRQVTKDQSYVELLVASGAITREQAETSAHRNVILQAMGQKPTISVALGRLELRRGDIFLICSDGLSGKVKELDMLGAALGAPSFAAGCSRLVSLANARGGEDNITVVLARVDGEGLPLALEEETLSKTFEPIHEYDPLKAK